MRALVTGAAGFIGSTLCEKLISSGHEVVGLDCFLDFYPRGVKEGNIAALRGSDRFEFVEASLIDVALGEYLAGVDYVFHQAAQAGVRTSWGDEFRIYSDNNVFATQRLLEACVGSPSLKKFVYASSSSIYGDTDDLPMREGSIPKPVSPYGVTKLAAEHLTWLYWKNYSLPTVSLRYFTVYGPRQRPDMAFHRFIRSVLEEKPIKVFGDGEQSRDFTFVDDIVAANIAAAESDIAGEVFNLGGGTRTTVNVVLDTIGEILGKNADIVRSETQKGDVRHTSADTSKARSMLGYSPTVDIREGLTREADWLRSTLV